MVRGRIESQCASIALFLLALPLVARSQATTLNPSATEAAEVEFQWGAKIPLRDGVKLNATLYLPKDRKEPLPVVFTMTPYIGDSYHARALYFARRGYIFALVDVRGRGNSQGEFHSERNDASDGYDVVEWLARQPWSNGKVTMWGGSYAGYNQWATVMEFPPHLATIVPAAAAHPGVDSPAVKNIFASYDTQWVTLVTGVTPNTHIFEESAFWISKFREMYLRHQPFRQLDRIVGNPSADFQEWLQHPALDNYWDGKVPGPEHYRRINLPILTITGHYDGDQGGALTYYRRHMRYGTAEARAQHYLIIGPWDHAGTRTPNREVGGLKFGEASMLDLNNLHREWYDWTMKGGAKPAFLKKRIAYYVTGADEWKYADDLETLANAKRTLYLQSGAGGAGDAFHSGALAEEKPGAAAAATHSPGTSTPDTYTYDPLDTRPEELERTEVPNYLTDQRYALNLYGGGLVYHSAPFASDTEVSGFLKLTAWIAMDVPDTDFQASVYEILADGTSIALTSDLLRARYRESLREEHLVKAGEIQRYEFDGFTFFSRRIAKGSRLRLVFSSPNSIYLEKNYNGGGVVAEESGKDARTAHVKVFHDAEHPSALELPIVNPAGGARPGAPAPLD